MTEICAFCRERPMHRMSQLRCVDGWRDWPLCKECDEYLDTVRIPIPEDKQGDLFDDEGEEPL